MGLCSPITRCWRDIALGAIQTGHQPKLDEVTPADKYDGNLQLALIERGMLHLHDALAAGGLFLHAASRSFRHAKDGHYRADKRSPPRFEKAFPERLDTIAREKEIVDRCATGPFASSFARAALQTDDKLSKLRSTAGADDRCRSRGLPCKLTTS
jgi:hypothetical protein